MDLPTTTLEARLLLGVAAPVTTSEVSLLLGVDAESIRCFLDDHSLVRRLGEQEFVVWGDVLQALHGPTKSWMTTLEAAAVLGVDRGVLDEVASKAHERRPDLVAVVGSGRSRRTYRWKADGLGEAIAAARAPKPRSAPKPLPRPHDDERPPPSRHGLGRSTPR